MKFISRKTIPRRQFLQGAGVGIALPLLDAMIPAFATTDKEDKTRLVCIEEVHGLAGCNKQGAEKLLFAPSTVGYDYQLVPENPLKSLEPVSYTHLRAHET